MSWAGCRKILQPVFGFLAFTSQSSRLKTSEPFNAVANLNINKNYTKRKLDDNPLPKPPDKRPLGFY